VRQLQLREAKAGLSAVVDQAMQGEPSVITRRGKPAAVVLSYDEWQRLSNIPSFGRLLMSLPLKDDTLLERDQTPLPEAEL